MTGDSRRLALRIHVPDADVTKTLVFDALMTVGQACDQILHQIREIDGLDNRKPVRTNRAVLFFVTLRPGLFVHSAVDLPEDFSQSKHSSVRFYSSRETPKDEVHADRLFVTFANQCIGSQGSPKEYGLFLPHEDSKKGLWLDPSRSLEHYILRNGVSRPRLETDQLHTKY
ncbi:unnamed protein product [Dibothriocephalus latus]|uniref:Talin N-terminal F0 domain-containing protein n=1 Tax=Dibothriocephalus latus TaxID=60516 RepID=A0A3P7NUZ8_DIBLA|nr:unnamed protein product [Dibothriocephalus latus]